MSAAKWAYLDGVRTAHWWLGNEGTVCGRDFKRDLRIADDEDDPLCPACVAGLDERGISWI